MAVLQETQIIGRAEAALINGAPEHDITTRRIGSVAASFDGLAGDRHSTLVRAACARTSRQYKIGTPIRNTRQITIISVEDLAEIARRMGVGGLSPEELGANLWVPGIPAFTHVPPSSRLIFSGGASLVVDLENAPAMGRAT